LEKTIFLIDDSPTACGVIKGVLTRAGYIVETESSPKEALRRISSGGIAGLSLIISDIEMPGMNGIELCRAVKADPDHTDVPVVFVTNLERTDTISQAFDAGAADFLNKPFRKIELLARVRSLLKLKDEIDRRKKREEELVERERELLDINRMLEIANQTVMLSASIDSLTGITNRRTFDSFMSVEWPRALRISSRVAVAMIDIDNFKKFNDNYGHQAGDNCLHQVAVAMRGSITRSDAIFARYGGEEFILFIPGVSHGFAAEVVENMRKAVEECAIPHGFSNAGPVVSVSIGLFEKNVAAGDTLPVFIEHADKSLYKAKEEGRNRVVGENR
jgi:diguanylate cyclase (GGDEF)-like protein